MALADFLNADVETIGQQLRAGFDWWVAELAAILPARWRSARAGGIVAELGRADIGFYRDGRRLSGVRKGARVTVAIPASRALLREITLPRLSGRDTRRLIALDLDRLTPFDPASAVWDFVPANGSLPLDRQQLRLGVVRREDAVRAVVAAADLGLEVVGVSVSQGEGTGRFAFDFLPQLRDVTASRPWWAEARTWWITAGVLALANVGLAVARDRADVLTLGDTVAAQQDAVQLARRLKGRVRAEDARRAAEVARRAAQDPLRPLAAATRAIPTPAWVQRATWDGHALRLTGLTVDGVYVETALRRSPAFGTVRATSSDLQPTFPRYQPFDVTAEARAAQAAGR